MKRELILAALALGSTAAVRPAAAAPQEPARPLAVLEAAPKGTVVFDDDGGRVQIVPRREVPDGEVTYHGGPVIARGNVRTVFLGSGWGDDMIRRRESQAMEALAARGHAGQAREDGVDPARPKSISDLEIQRRLDSAVGKGPAGPLDASAVYVIFLAPGVQSTLGASSSERDFAAYHNHFHAAAGVVRYVVVPYEDDFARWVANAERSLVQALRNPEGNGWY